MSSQREKKWTLKTPVTDERMSISTHPLIAKARAELFSNYFPVRKELVYGCSGIGTDVFELHSIFEKVYCFDMDDKAVMTSRKIFKERGIENAIAKVGDITKKETFHDINTYSVALITPYRSYAEEGGRGFYKRVDDMKPHINDVLRALPSSGVVYELPVTFNIVDYFDLMKTISKFSYKAMVTHIVYYIVDGGVKMKEAWIEKTKNPEEDEPKLIIYNTADGTHYSFLIEPLVNGSSRAEIEEKFKIRL